MSLALSRRAFLRQSATISGGLLLNVNVQAATERQAGAVGLPREGTIGFFVRIEPNGPIVIGSPQPEMGQGVRTSLPMLIAEELDVSWDAVTVEQMPLGIKRSEEGEVSWLHVGQGAGGSTSVSDAWIPLREAGAVARQQLLSAAAEKWNVPKERLTTQDGVVMDAATNSRAGYGELAAVAAALPLPENSPPLKSPDEFRIIGRGQAAVDGRDIVTGLAVYGVDAEMPGQVYACVERCPWHDGAVKDVDDTAALAVKGVIAVVPIEGPKAGQPYTVLASGVAVVADSTWSAFQGRRALKVSWDRGPHADESSASLRAQMEKALQQEGQVVAADGDADAALVGADSRHSARYFVPYASHAPMEPQCCVVHVREDGADVIAPVQMPSGASRMVNRLTGLDRMSINVNMTRLGGGFGRRLTVDYVAEATLISMAVKRPVKLQWTREDDLRHDFYRPSGLHELHAGLDERGTVVAWKHRLASASKYYRRSTVAEEDMWTAELYQDDPPRKLVHNVTLEYHSMRSGVPRGSWRAPAHYANAFAIQSFLDEIARAQGEDPLALQLRLLGEAQEYRYENHGGPVFDSGRLAGVLRLAAEKANWGSPLAAGRGRGIAGHFTFGSYCASVVEVTVEGADLRIDRVVGAVDCGFAVNPNHVKSQMEGGAIDGISTALRLAITLEEGRIQQSNFDNYTLASMVDAPRRMETYIVESDLPPSGMGEPPISPIAPALCNAIFDACGKRIRELPIGNQLA